MLLNAQTNPALMRSYLEHIIEKADYGFSAGKLYELYIGEDSYTIHRLHEQPDFVGTCKKLAFDFAIPIRQQLKGHCVMRAIAKEKSFFNSPTAYHWILLIDKNPDLGKSTRRIYPASSYALKDSVVFDPSLQRIERLSEGNYNIILTAAENEPIRIDFNEKRDGSKRIVAGRSEDGIYHFDPIGNTFFIRTTQSYSRTENVPENLAHLKNMKKIDGPAVPCGCVYYTAFQKNMCVPVRNHESP